MPHPTTSTQDKRSQSETNSHVGRCLTSEMTRKQGPILSRMVPQCVVLVQIEVKSFPCGAQSNSEFKNARQKGQKWGGAGVI